jgi:pimeloyl-ACP methyl ester carboxylesterase
MMPSLETSGLLPAAALMVVMALSSCSAPISYRRQVVPVPAAASRAIVVPDAARQLKAAGKQRSPLAAAGHYFDIARMASGKAMAGDETAMALYNHAVARLVETLEEAHALPWGTTLEIGGDSARRRLRGRLEPGILSRDRRIVVVDTLEFGGPYAGVHATRDGVGAPVVAISAADDGYRNRFEAPESYVALTAVLRFDSPDSGTLEFHNPLDVERLAVSGHDPVLAAEFTSPTALALARTRLDRLGLVRLFNPRRFSNDAALFRLQHYDGNRIPVLMVHGLQDTPATWFTMYQQLLSDPVLRKHFQFWVFCYPSGLPYPYTASLLRRELDGVRRAFPDHKDIVLVGHSMGGIISRLMVTDAGDTIWRNMFGKGPEELEIPGISRQLLHDSLVFNKRDEVGRAVFIATPHRGSMLASSWIGRAASRLVRLPSYLTDVRNDVASVLVADAAGLQLNFAPNSIDTLNPNNGFVREVNKLPVAPGVPFHSIIGDRGRGDTPDSSDGVVAYWSSHMDGAASEKIVPSNHSAHQNPEAILEVKRILKLHLKEDRRASQDVIRANGGGSLKRATPRPEGGSRTRGGNSVSTSSNRSWQDRAISYVWSRSKF